MAGHPVCAQSADMSASQAAKVNTETATYAPDDHQLGHNPVGLASTLAALLEVLEGSAPAHPLRAQVEQALSSGSTALLRGALAAWYKLPRIERDRILR